MSDWVYPSLEEVRLAIEQGVTRNFPQTFPLYRTERAPQLTMDSMLAAPHLHRYVIMCGKSVIYPAQFNDVPLRELSPEQVTIRVDEASALPTFQHGGLLGWIGEARREPPKDDICYYVGCVQAIPDGYTSSCINVMTCTDDGYSPDNQATFALLCRAHVLNDWHTTQRFCSQCGSPIKWDSHGIASACSAHCGRPDMFPPYYPCVIVLVTDMETRTRLLLARRPASTIRGEVYTCVAGYIDSMESSEAAVLRELCEEIGLDTNIRIGPFRVGEQPWNYSFSVLSGYLLAVPLAAMQAAEADGEEMLDCRVVTAKEMHSPDFPMPAECTLAMTMMRAWLSIQEYKELADQEGDGNIILA